MFTSGTGRAGGQAPSCPRCGRPRLDAQELAGQAEAVRRIIAEALDLARGGAGAGVGPRLRRRLLEQHLMRAEGLALALSRVSSCIAGSCAAQPTNEP